MSLSTSMARENPGMQILPSKAERNAAKAAAAENTRC